MRVTVRALGVLIAGMFIFGGGYAKAETLQDAVQLMLQTNPEIKSLAFNRLARDEEVTQAKAGYLPTLEFSYTAGFENNYEPLGEISRPRSAKLSLRQNLFSGFADQYELERQRARVSSAAYRLQGTSEQIALGTSRVYLNVLRQLELLDLARQNLLTHQRIYDQIKLRSESGIDRKADLDQVMGRLALSESDVVVSKANVADARTDYHFVVGTMPENLLKPHSVDTVMPVSLEEAQMMAEENYPILKSAEADLQARLAQHAVAKSSYYPKLDIAVDQKWEHEVEYSEFTKELTAAAVVRFNLFNGYRDQARLAETGHLIKEAEEIQNNTRRQIIESIRLSWVAFQATQNRINYLQDYVKATGATAEAFSKQWNIGRRTMFDVLDIEAELINAKIGLVNAQYDKTYAQFRILSDMGKLVHTLGLQWPAESIVEGEMQKEDTSS